MKKNIFIFYFLFLFTFGVFSQHKNKYDKKAELHSKKIAFLTDNMQLSPEEAEVFWPLYNECYDKLKSLHKDEKRLIKKLHNSKEMLEKEIEKLNDKICKFYVERAKLKEEYYLKYKKILSPRQITALNLGERNFRHLLMKKIRHKHNNKFSKPIHGEQ